MYVLEVIEEVLNSSSPWGKVKLSLCLTKHHSMKAYWGVDV
jgi:hypothetical protein